MGTDRTNTSARQVLGGESHREGLPQGGTEAEGALEAGAVPGSPGAEAVLGRGVCFLMGGRGTVEDNQDQESGPPLWGILDQRC